MTKVTIKVLRRAESELDNELKYVQNRLSSARNQRQASASAATATGTMACNEFIIRHGQLLEAKFDIRKAVGQFNQDKDINLKTGKIAALEAQLNALDTAMGFGSVSECSSYGATKLEYRPGIDAEYVDKLRSDSRSLKRQVQRLKDSCNGINSSEDASPYIGDKTLEFLKSNNFID